MRARLGAGMRALAVTDFGGPDALHVVDIEEPQAGPGQVRIRVHAATVNPTDTIMRSGGYADRLDGEPSPYVPGMDAAGVIDQVGEGAPWTVGDRVMALVVPYGDGRRGAYADQVVVPAASVTSVPAQIDLEHASTLLMNAMTARVCLDELALPAGSTVAVTGAAGAFGGYAVQLAKADGLHVIADAQASDEQLVRALGADVVVPRGEDIAEQLRKVAPDGVDGLIDGSAQGDLVGGAIGDGGGMATVRGYRADPGRGIVVHRILVGKHVEQTAALDTLRDQAVAGVLRLRVAQVLPAEQAPEAHRLLEAGGVRGRLVLDFSS